MLKFEYSQLFLTSFILYLGIICKQARYSLSQTNLYKVAV